MEQTPKDPQRPSNASSAGKGCSARRRKGASAADNTESQPALDNSPTETSAQAETAAADETVAKQATLKEAVAEPTDTAPATATSEVTQPVAQRSGSGAALTVSVLALIVGLGALGFSGWMWQQDQQERVNSAALTNEVSNLKQQLQQKGAELRGTLEQLQQVQLQNQQSIGQVQAGFAEAERNIQAEQKKLKTLTPQSWLLAEASYLVQMAERKLVLEQDPATALNLLQDADSRLALLNSSSLKPLRQALQNDMAKVQSLPRVDRDGIGMGIEALVREIDKLPLNRVELPEVIEAPQSNELSSQLDDWRANLVRSWHALMEDFITIRRRADQVQPLLEPAQEWYLREHLRGKLLQAQLALYHGDASAMQQALKTAQQWLRDYFNLDSNQVESALERLDKWQNANLTQVKSIQFESLEGLKQAADDKLLREAP